MCGICGEINFKGNGVNQDILEKMTDTLSHRGPDDKGLFLDGQIGLGHRRLSVIDLSERGRQPMHDNEKNIFIVFNGEIYNFKELRKELEKEGAEFNSGTDTEVIIHLYKKYGFDCLRRLRGMFAFAIWDSREKLLFAARDRLGKKPFKYYIDEEKLIFASELKAILANPGVKREMDLSAVDEFLTFKYVPQPKTGFLKIQKLPPASYLTVKANGEMKIESYWDLDFSKKDDLSESEWEERIEKAIKEAVSVRLESDVPLGAHLSGGIDSGLITAMMAEASNKKIKTFSIGFEEARYNELPFARLVAKKYDTDHRELTVKPDGLNILPKLAFYYEEPYADASAIPYWHLSELTKKHITVALNGDGGDENFAGYERYGAPDLYRFLKLTPAKKTLAMINSALFRASKIGRFNQAERILKADHSSLLNFYLSLIAYFSPSDKAEIYGESLQNFNNNRPVFFTDKHFFGEKPVPDDLDKLLYIGLKTFLPDDLLVKADIASMAHGLEMRSPLLDQNLVELSARMPASLKIKNGQKKYLLKKIASKYLPAECIHRPKHGFTVPLEYWFKGELFNFLSENILQADFIGMGFKKDGVEKLLNDHKDGRQNNENKLYALLMLNLWRKEWS